MVEPTGWWATAVRDVLNVLIRGVPQTFLRWRWPASKILAALTVFGDAQPCFFYIGSDRPSHDLESLNFHVVNLSPLQLSLVGVELEIELHSMTWLNISRRFATASPLSALSRGGFSVRETLTEQQTQLLVREPDGLVRMRVRGKVIVKSPFGEHRKDVLAEVTASIVRQ